jgi:hypothetical protein
MAVGRPPVRNAEADSPVAFRTQCPFDPLVAHFGHQFVHVHAGVIAGDIGVKVLPQSLHAVVVWAVRRQEVQPNPPAEPANAARVIWLL